MQGDNARRAEARGRVVMVVDNGVNGDSRVQKQARSAAERGWDVVLVGRSPNARKHSWRVGGARVRLVPMPSPLARPRHEFRWAPLRSPLAYPVGPGMAYAQQRVLARSADLANRRAALEAHIADGTTGGIRGQLSRLRLGVARNSARVHRKWVHLRVRRTAALTTRRRAMTSPVDRASTAFWKAIMGDRAWRRLEPGLWDYELAYGPVIDRLKPDLIHANDYRMIGVGANATARARAKGQLTRLVWDAHEFLPGVSTEGKPPRWHDGMLAYEEEYVPAADAVITVSDTMADLLIARFHLTDRPAVVLNAPTTGPEGGDQSIPTVRELCELDSSVQLMVYSGAVGLQRGLRTVVDALPELPDVHLALVAGSLKVHVPNLLERASKLGVQDRIHPLPYVALDDICRYLSSATVGIHPALHYPNYEVDLHTKFFEYSQARLPVVVSDLKTVGDEVRRTGQGEVFRAGDTSDFVTAVRRVLADPEKYRAAYNTPGLLESWLWEPQADILEQVYSKLLPG